MLGCLQVPPYVDSFSRLITLNHVNLRIRRYLLISIKIGVDEREKKGEGECYTKPDFFVFVERNVHEIVKDEEINTLTCEVTVLGGERLMLLICHCKGEGRRMY